MRLVIDKSSVLGAFLHLHDDEAGEDITFKGKDYHIPSIEVCMERFQTSFNKMVRDYDEGPHFASEKDLAVFKTQPEAFKEKVWAHRVNNIDKLVSASKTFYGIELDVCFDFHHNIFDVTHDQPIKNYLSLDDYWSNLDNPENLKFWLAMI